MKKKLLALLAATTMAVAVLSGCNANTEVSSTEEVSETTEASTEAGDGQVASPDEMSSVEDVVEPGMTPIEASQIKDGTYEVEVKSSSSMFNIVSCELTVAGDEMTAVMTMGGTGYLYVFMGTGEEAVEADESQYIPYEEVEEGVHTFTVPVKALDEAIDCTAFSKKKEKWYDRQILFRADSLPSDAFEEGFITSWDSLGLEDGEYTVDVTLAGGSGRATVESPAKVRVEDGVAYATIIWSSPNYDYMKVNDMQYMPINTDGNSTFEIPIMGLDYNMPVVADTVAMSEPHEIQYTLNFDSKSVK